MWERNPHLLHNLKALTSPKVKFKCTDMEQKEFDKIERTVAHDTLLAYPYFNKCFNIHTDTSYYQLGAAISKNCKPIAFYSHKSTEIKK